MAYIKKIKTSPYHINVWFTDSPDLYVKQVEKITGEWEESPGKTCGGICFYTKDRLNIIIGLFDDSMYTLVHEVTHAVLRLFEGVGMKVCGQTTEAHAYLTEDIFRQCYKIHDKLREVIINEQETAQTSKQASNGTADEPRVKSNPKPPRPAAE